ncbi:hypothetical protein Vadar_029131 [Vaccinium darrowii]|uniref:Uncharacterized protein n=1 Tax=Vaccinium darrowii TaxID=229202 RepID=A0ACB7XVH1_9ERIC|nr:hypothetical protein Vadar_029131 [Vaccinium darrowii]
MVDNSSNPLLNQNDGEAVPNSTPDCPSKLRSHVWQHFSKANVNGVSKAICNYCKKQFASGTNSGTSHLSNHYERKHKKGSLRQQVLKNNFNKENPQLTSYTFDHDTAKKELASAIIMHDYPLSIVDHVGFKRYSLSLQSLFKVPCRNTIKGEIFKIYDYEKVKTLSLVESNQSRLAIMTNMWTSSNQKRGFMAITAHFIDDAWTLQSRILRFTYVPCPHTKEVLCDTLLDCLLDWNLDRKISYITVDKLHK